MSETRHISWSCIASEKPGWTVFIKIHIPGLQTALHGKADKPRPHDPGKGVSKAVLRFAQGAGTLDFSRV
jgi:hypothetical protein